MTPPEPVVIWGAGAMGGSIGAWLHRAGHDVLLVRIDKEHLVPGAVQPCADGPSHGAGAPDDDGLGRGHSPIASAMSSTTCFTWTGFSSKPS